MIADISYPTAVFAGILSFASPCVLPLVPPYLCYMAGVSVEELRTGRAKGPDAGTWRRVLTSALVFVLGFSSVFILLGAGASSIGRLLRQNMDWLGIAAGIAIIVMGLNFLGVLRLDLLSREARLQAPGKPASLIGAYLMGLAFAFGWTPCIGPVLGAILGLAGAKNTAAEGATMLAFYSAGLGIPFLVAAMFSGAFLSFTSRFRGHFGTVEKVMGGFLVLTGILFLTGGMQRASFWLLEAFPFFQTIG